MYFDARAAKLLQPGAHMVVDGCQGLRLVVTATRKTWTYRYKADDGRMKQIALGQWPLMSAAQAAAAWQEQRDARAAGIDPRAARKAVKAQAAGPLLVRQLVQGYIDGHLLPSRAKEGGQAARKKLLQVLDDNPAFAAMEPAAVSRSVAFELIDGLKATPNAAAKVRSMMGSAWDYALDAGRIDGDVPNWWRLVHKGRLKSKGKIMGGQHVGRVRRVLSQAEVAALLQWQHHMHALGSDVLTMYLWTCCRGGEIVDMRPEFVALEGDVLWWTIPKMASKNARFYDAVDQRVPLFGRARAVVERRMASVGQSGLLFEDRRGEQYTQRDFGTYVYSLQPYSVKVMRRESTGGLLCPVTHWSPHRLRHTARTLLASLGCPNEVGEAIMGHMPEQIVDTYNAYTYDAERMQWLGRLSDRLEELATSGPGGA